MVLTDWMSVLASRVQRFCKALLAAFLACVGDDGLDKQEEALEMRMVRFDIVFVTTGTLVVSIGFTVCTCIHVMVR